MVDMRIKDKMRRKLLKFKWEIAIGIMSPRNGGKNMDMKSICGSRSG